MTALLTACSPSEKPAAEPKSFSDFAMDTYMTVTVFDGNMDTALEESHAEIKRLEKLWSVTDKNSEIYSLDHSGGKTVAVGNETAELIRFAVEMNEKTDGALDISLYPILAEWGFTTGDYKIPSDETITAMLQNVRCSEIGVEGQNITLPQGMSIDLGSIGKGETGDRITAILKENGVTSAMLDLGGNIQTIGSKPDGSDWKIGIQDPFGDGNIAKLSVSDKCVITSGGYERFFVGEDGETYWHILDPSTGRPAHSGIVSATVVGDKGRLCDALSTSLFVMGEERAKEFWRNNGGFDMILITEDGRLLVTEGLENNVELADGRKDIKTEVIEDKTAVG